MAEPPAPGQSPLDTVSEDFRTFWTEAHLSTLTTVRPNGTPHVVPVGVTLDAATATARVITSSTSRKVRNVLAAGPQGAPVAVCQEAWRRWSTLEGLAVVRDDPDSVADAEHRYEQRYDKRPRPNPKRVVVEIAVRRVLGSV